MTTNSSSNDGRRAVWTVLLVALLLRLVLFAVYRPALYPDSQSYLEFARMLAARDLRGFWGAHPPGYPLLLVLLRENPWSVWIVQSLCGIASAWLVTRALLERTGRSSFAVFGGVLTAASPSLLFFEPSLLTESLAALLLTLAGTTLIRLLVRDERRALPWAGLGIVCGLAAWTRPSLTVLVPACVLAAAWTNGVRARLPQLAALALPGVVLVLAWCSINCSYTGAFSPSTMSGINLLNHTGAWIEDAPGEYADIQALYLPARAQRGTQVMTYWYVRDELVRRTGSTDAELAARLLRMDFALIAKRPGRYALSASRAWARFWSAPPYWQSERLRFPALDGPATFFTEAGHRFFIGWNALFLALVLAAVAGCLRGNRRWLPLLAGTLPVLALSLLQALMEFGENGRYGVPTQPLVVLLACWAVAELRPASQLPRTL